MHAPAKPDYPVITPAELPNFDAFIFGIPTRYGNFPAQWKVRFRFLPSRRDVRVQGCLPGRALASRVVGPIWLTPVSPAIRLSGTPPVRSGPRARSQASTRACSSRLVHPVEDRVSRFSSALSGAFTYTQISAESTVLASISTLAHHGILFVPLGYSTTFAQLANLSEVRGGSPWGAGTFAGADGSRSPSALELELAVAQGKLFWKTVKKVAF